MSVMEDIVEYDQIGALATQHERACYSPIEHVPAEILCDIFLSWIEEQHSCWQGGHRLVFLDSPFLLTRVCTQWRNIIYDTPHLWASPHVRVPSGMDITDEWMEKLVAYLARSKTGPLFGDAGGGTRAGGAREADKGSDPARWEGLLATHQPPKLCLQGVTTP